MTISGNEQKEFINARDRRGRLVVTGRTVTRCEATHPIVQMIDGSTYPVDAQGLIAQYRLVPVELPPDERLVSICCDWLNDRVKKIKTPNVSSSSLKHAAEIRCGESLRGGHMIVALHRCGFRMRTPYGHWTAPLGVKAGVGLLAYRKLPEVIRSLEGHR